MAEVRRRNLFPPGLVFFTVAYMMICSVMAFKQGNKEFLVYAGSMVVFIALVMHLHARVRLSNAALWMLSVWGATHMLGGTVPIPASMSESETTRHVLYALRPVAGLPRYDQIVHAYGFFTATIAAWECLRKGLGARPGVGLSASAALIGVGLGAVNEVLEFGVTLVVEDHGVGGYTNTGWDLVSNAVGCLIAGVATLSRR
jgi:uncharacterized membrane protein YjdF